MEKRTGNNYRDLQEMLAGKGLKVTHQRLVILKALLSLPDHPTAEMLYSELKENNPTLSLGTIYKSLETFVEKGLIKKVRTEEGSIRYDSNLDAHNHIFCTRTNKIFDFHDEELEALLEDYFKKKKLGNFNIRDIQVQINGEVVDARKKPGIKE